MEETSSSEMNSHKYYSGRVEDLKKEVAHLKNKSRRWVVLRLLGFFAMPITAYFFFEYGLITAVAVILELVIFLYFVRKSAENKEALNFVKNLLWINESELKALNGDVSAFYDGTKFKDPKHAFSYDFDVFGASSFYQYFNRTVSSKGAKKLAGRLLNGVADETKEHEAITELLEHLTWTQHFRARGIEQAGEYEELENNRQDLSSWGRVSLTLPKWTALVHFITPFFAVLISIAYYFDFINGLEFSFGAILALFPAFKMLKKTNAIHKEFVSHEFRINALRAQLLVLKEVDFNCEKLKKYQELLFTDQNNGLKAVVELNDLVKKFEYRNNILVAVILNFYLSWDTQQLNKLIKWKSKYGASLEAWESIVLDMECLICGANFRYNNYATTSYPQLKDPKEASIQIKEMGHPLIPSDKLVNNNYEMSEENFFSIITGPNMAGKSTFLRSVGVNLMLAKAGYPVMAQQFQFPKLNLYSSMRTSDDLSNESSYFHAELVRLRFIADAIDRGEPVFIILDEILKGTNSKDKEEGSAKFLTKLVEKGARGIIATHDLKLTELAASNSALVNLYFDTTISGDDISFDYTIREGVAQNMNASFLLRKMNLTD